MKLVWVPNISRTDWRLMLYVSLLGGCVAGPYGMLHDQVTYSISPEYFRCLKFEQFRFADVGFGERAFVATIGFMATFWVGFCAAWLLARRHIPGQARTNALRSIRQGLGWVFGFAFVSGCLGFVYGFWRGPDASYASWLPITRALGVRDVPAFAHVGYIHNAGYLGALLGLVFALLRKPLPNSRSIPSSAHSS